MKVRIPSELCRALIFNWQEPRWNEDDLLALRTWEVQILCQLIGAPKSGVKEKLIVRLLTTRTVREALTKFKCDQDGVAALVAENRKERLKWMCKMMCLWRSGSKLQMAITLLQWRDRCRVEGQKFLDLLMRPVEGPMQPRQLEFKLV